MEDKEIENPQDVEKEEEAAKTYTEAEYTAMKSQLDEVMSQYKAANEAIASYKEMDIDGIKASADEWKQKYEAAEESRKQQEYSDKLEKFVGAQGCKNAIYANYLKSQLQEKQLKFDGDTLLGGEDVVKKLRESCPDAFADDDKKPYFADSAQGAHKKQADDDAIRRIMGLK